MNMYMYTHRCVRVRGCVCVVCLYVFVCVILFVCEFVLLLVRARAFKCVSVCV